MNRLANLLLEGYPPAAEEYKGRQIESRPYGMGFWHYYVDGHYKGTAMNRDGGIRLAKEWVDSEGPLPED